MLRITSDLIANKLIFINKSGVIKGVGSSKIVDKANIVGKTNIRLLKSRPRFLTLRAKLVFTKLK